MEQNPANPDNVQTLLEEQRQRIAELETRAKKYEDEWSALYDQSRDLREETHRLRHDYETLRIQKGGFGFKMLLFSGLGGFFTALILCFIYVKIKPKEPSVAAFRQFQRENLINFELAIGKGQFGEVERTLDNSIARPEYAPIEAQLVFMREMMKATKNHCK